MDISSFTPETQAAIRKTFELGLQILERNMLTQELIAAGYTPSEARKLVASGRVIYICKNCGACRCEECVNESDTCKHCGAKAITLHRRGHANR